MQLTTQEVLDRLAFAGVSTRVFIEVDNGARYDGTVNFSNASIVVLDDDGVTIQVHTVRIANVYLGAREDECRNCLQDPYECEC